MTDIDRLIKRLRNYRMLPALTGEISPEFAIHELTALRNEAADELSRLRGREEEYRKALEPFAAAKGHFDGHVRDDDTVEIALRHIRAHHVRAAARALSPTKQKGDQDGGKPHGGGL